MINRAATSPTLRYTLIGLTLLSLVSGGWSLYALLINQTALSWKTTLQLAAERYALSLKDIETSHRGYTISGSEDFLEPYQKAMGEIDLNTQVLKEVAAKADFSNTVLVDLLTAGQSVLNFAEAVIAARQRSFEEAQSLVLTRVGKLAMDKVRDDLGTVAAWTRQESNRLHAQRRSYVPIIISSLVALALTVGIFIFFAARSRRASMQSRLLLADVIERAPVGLALLDRNLHINQANKAFARMVSENGVMKTGEALSSVAPQTEGHLHQRIQRALTSRHRFNDKGADEILALSIGDQPRYCKADVFPVTLVSETGAESLGAGIVLNDMTRQRESELELEIARDAAEAANRAKSAFIANMSHELRTPLTAVLGYCELIEEDLSDAGQAAILADVNKINANARHLLGLINDVLDLSKIEAQKMDVHAIEFTLSTLLAEIEAATGSLIAKNNNTLSLSAEVPDTVMLSDDLKIKQILLNLIGNAAKFTTNGKIAVGVSQIEENGLPQTRFTVQDTGIGMSKEQLANLFQRFAQADQTTTRKYGGTGLGLALARALSKMLGGRIDVESVEGEGTTFTVTVPTRYEAQVVHTTTAKEVAADQSKAGDAAATQSPSILVVDDDPSARELLTRHLEREGFAVTTASSGAEALEHINTHKPLAVLLDVMMPGLDGWHVLRAIRNNPHTKDIPVIMQTVLDERNFAYALGATGYLKKPVRRDVLAEALQSLEIATASRQVLIVDDDRDANDRLMEMLTRDGWNCRMALNGAEALKALADYTPDLVLVDLIMPEMDGYAFIREVRNNQKFDALPLVVMTATDVGADKVRKLSSDTAGIVQKGAMPLADLVADLRRFANQAKIT